MAEREGWNLGFLPLTPAGRCASKIAPSDFVESSYRVQIAPDKLYRALKSPSGICCSGFDLVAEREGWIRGFLPLPPTGRCASKIAPDDFVEPSDRVQIPPAKPWYT